MHEPDGYLDGAANDEVSRRPPPRPADRVLPRRPQRGAPPSRRRAARSTPARAASSCTRAARRSPSATRSWRPRRAGSRARACRCSSTPAAASPRWARTPSGSRAYPDAKLILAHAAISDLAGCGACCPSTRTSNRHELVEPGRRHRALHARAAGPGPVGERLPVRRAAGRPPCRGCAARSRPASPGADPGDRRRPAGPASPARRCSTSAARRPGTRPLDPTLDRVVSHLCATIGRGLRRRRRQ